MFFFVGGPLICPAEDGDWSLAGKEFTPAKFSSIYETKLGVLVYT
jgi:hypothetical protein